MSEAQTDAARQAHRMANRNAAIAVACVAVFAALFLGLAFGIRSLAAPDMVPDIEVANTTMPTEPTYVLLIGSDSRKGTALYTGKPNEHAQVNQHSDIMTLMRIDPTTYTVTLVTIPRDTVMPGGSGKINDSLLTNDPTQVVGAVEQLTGVKIDHYMMVTFTGFASLVDALGGVTVDVPQTVTVPDPGSGQNLTVNAGKNQRLDGAQALVFARARKEYDGDQDAKRQINVRAIEAALIRQVLAQGNSVDMNKILEILEEDVITDLNLPVTGMVMASFVEHANEVTIYSCTGPYDGDTREGDGLWVVSDNPATWQRLMEAVDAGEDPAGIVEPPSF